LFVLFTKYYLDDEIKGDEVDGTWSTHAWGQMKHAYEHTTSFEKADLQETAGWPES
jgi:hypothetical protein